MLSGHQKSIGASVTPPPPSLSVLDDAHLLSVPSECINVDDQYIVSGSADSAVKLWYGLLLDQFTAIKRARWSAVLRTSLAGT